MDSEFYRALSLSERARLPKLSLEQMVSGDDAQLASQLLEEWKSQAPFNIGDLFHRRVAVDGITELEFQHLLGETPESIESRTIEPPDWLKEIETAFRGSVPAEAGFELPDYLAEVPEAKFLNLIRPLMDRGFHRLRDGISRLLTEPAHSLIDRDSVSKSFFSSLAATLLNMLVRTMVLELNVARLEGKLKGDSPEARFENYASSLKDCRAALALLSEYPVLARRVVQRIDRWVAYGIEFVGRLIADWSMLLAKFCSGHDPGPLVEVTGGAGDSHRGGRSVLLLRFASGMRLVYKPRPVAVDRHFQDFIEWANGIGIQPRLRTIKVEDRNDHGWYEFVEAKSCGSQDEVRKFYERQGIYLALLYVLQAVDLHFENLIASGEHPVLIDLESLFHPDVRNMTIDQPDVKLIAKFLTDSVLRIGLLPRRSWAHDKFEGIDLSGLGAQAGQKTPDDMLDFHGSGTDQMRAVKSAMEMPAGFNKPSIGGLQADVLDYVDHIAAGFSRAYKALQIHRDELLAPDGPLAVFSKDQVRVVVRATRGYGLLLQESWHPDFLRDGLDLDLFLDRIWVGAEDDERLLSAVPSERADLADDDIPLFTTTPVSHDLVSSRGSRLPNYVDETSMSRVERRIRALSQDDLECQLWLIRSSLATLALAEDELKWPRYDVTPPSNVPSWDEIRPALLKASLAAADRLISLSISDGECLTWLGLSFSGRQWSLDPLLEDMYGGSAGLVLCLAYLGAVTGEERYTKSARKALRTLQARLEYSRKGLTTIGAFSGWGGLLYLASHLATIWDDGAVLPWAKPILDDLPPLIEKDVDIDIVGGSAGCIGSLLSLYKVTGWDKAASLAIRCGERIISRATGMEKGVGWFTRIETHRPITGFSHGASGMAWSLIQLASATNHPRFLETALDAMVYERSHFDPDAGNWLYAGDPAPNTKAWSDGSLGLSVAWCYGAPGIGMARLAVLRCFDDNLIRSDLSAAVNTTLKKGFGRNHSLCHGDLGNLDFLTQAHLQINDPELDLAIRSRTAAVLESINHKGRLCGVPLGVESPALMNGLAGICYGLLRMAYPERVPSILTLDSPNTNPRA
jgi:type 2 lantibiotic biosynthesis protein LanM